jgi:hypothetical protein
VRHQLTFRELLKDPIYKQWVTRVPNVYPGDTVKPLWGVWIQMPDRKWIVLHPHPQSYIKTFNSLIRGLKEGALDGAISSTNRGWMPPRVSRKVAGKRQVSRYNMPPEHQWCPYCRRPTIFGYFTRHHAIPFAVNVEHQRCRICGARTIFVRRFQRG